MDLVKIAEEAFACGKEHPEFRSGDTVTVSYRIKEGNKERIQQFRGDVIRISGHGNKKRFTVRKMSGNVGVERIFPIESPFIEEIVVNRRGKKPVLKKEEFNLSYKAYKNRTEYSVRFLCFKTASK